MEARIGFARSMARKTLKEFDAIDPPVAIEQVIKFCGLTLEREIRENNWSGMLYGERIIVNAGHPETRQRFTAAHELGHAQLAHRASEWGFVDRPSFSDEGEEVLVDPGDAQEVEANEFAAELLAPRQWVKAYYQRLRDPDQMATAFGLSREAMWRACLRAGCIRSR